MTGNQVTIQYHLLSKTSFISVLMLRSGIPKNCSWLSESQDRRPIEDQHKANRGPTEPSEDQQKINRRPTEDQQKTNSRLTLTTS